MDLEKLDRLIKLLSALETLSKFPTAKFNAVQAKVHAEAEALAIEIEKGE